MLKKKIAAVAAVIITVSLFGTTVLAAPADGLTYDELLGNELAEGSFENGVNVNADRWVPKLNVKTVIDNTHNGSAGAILADQSASVVYSGFSMKSNRIYHAEAYIKLYADAADSAKLVLATKSGDVFAPIDTTAVKKTVNGSEWTKLEGDYIRYSDTDGQANVYCYIELEKETKFYLDDVVIKDASCILPAGTETVSVSGEKLRCGKIVVGADGKASAKVSIPIEKGVEYKLSSAVKLADGSQSGSDTERTAYITYKVGRSNKTGPSVTIGNDWTEAAFTATVIAATGSSAARDITLNITGNQGDVIYFKGIGASSVAAAPLPEANIESLTLDATQGANTSVSINADSNTVAIRYFYSIKNDTTGEWTLLRTGHTASGEISTVPSVYLDSTYVGRTIRLEAEPMNGDLVYGKKKTATVTVNEPFELGAVTTAANENEGSVTLTFNVGNTSGAEKNVAAMAAFYNAKGEMLAVGIYNQSIENGNTKEYLLKVNIVPASTDYYRIYLLDGSTPSGILSLFPLAAVK